MLTSDGRTDGQTNISTARTDRREHYVGTARTDGRTDEHYVGTARTDYRTKQRLTVWGFSAQFWNI